MSHTQQSIHRHIIDTITSYYTFLTRLPHIESSNLLLPPSPSGWQTINEVELRARGRTDEAIELLRHLPYLRNQDLPGPARTQTNITNDSLSVAYCDGELEHPWVHNQQPTPGHIIWLANQADKEGHYLLLDPRFGTITTWSPIYPGPPLPDSVMDEDILAPEDRWMNHATMPIGDFFDLCRRRYEKLLWIPVPGLRMNNSRGTAYHYERILNRGFQDECLYSDTDYGASDDESSSSTSEDAADDDNGNISSEEIDLLMADADTDGCYATEDVANLADPSRAAAISAVSRDENEYQTDVPFEDLPVERKQIWLDTKHAYYIYKNNGWPGNNWDRKPCKEQLQAWVKTKGTRT